MITYTGFHYLGMIKITDGKKLIKQFTAKKNTSEGRADMVAEAGKWIAVHYPKKKIKYAHSTEGGTINPQVREAANLTKCFLTGCKNPVAFEVKPKWDHPIFCTCAEHKPDIMKRPEALRSMPFFYDVTPI